MLATKNYGFVAFKSEIERDRVIGKLVTIHGKQARIAHDTREHKRTTGVMDEIWVRAHGSPLHPPPVWRSHLESCGGALYNYDVGEI